MIRDIVLWQKREFEQRMQEKYVPRGITFVSAASDMIQVIIGPRRAGKSFFGMHQLAKDEKFGFLNLDDERLVKVQNFDEILEAIMAVYGNPSSLLLDEIQNLADWELIVNRLQRQGFRLIITGSNSNLLSSELATHLTGRHLPVHLFTFSFSEYLASIEKQLTGPEKRERLNDWLINGGYPEESFILFTLPLFSYKVGEQQRGNKKIYCYDNGFHQAKGFQFSDDWGRLLENAVASELYKRCLYKGSKLFYWKDRDQQEVDFVIQNGTQVTELIQVCWNINQPKTLNREVRSLLKASEKLKCNRLLIITMEEEKKEEFSWFGLQRHVEFIPAQKWLLIRKSEQNY